MKKAVRSIESNVILESELDPTKHLIGLQFEHRRGFIHKQENGKYIAAYPDKMDEMTTPVEATTAQELIQTIRKGNLNVGEQFLVEAFVFDTPTEVLEWLLAGEYSNRS